MHGREQGLLFFKAKQVDLVDVENAFVSTVNGAGLNTVVSRGFHATGLERVVADVPEKGARERGRGVHEGWKFVEVVLHQHLWDAAVVNSTETASNEHVPEDQQEATEEKGEQITGLEGGDEQEEADGSEGDEQHAL